jgi:hypothetical protein
MLGLSRYWKSTRHRVRGKAQIGAGRMEIARLIHLKDQFQLVTNSRVGGATKKGTRSLEGKR